MMKDFNYILFAITAVLIVSCSGKKPSSKSGNKIAVIATSSWTAAYAEVAGAENVTVLAPFEMEHPSEYELRPVDISKLMNADVIIYAGYEVMTERLKKGLDIPQDRLLLVNTDYSYAAIEKSIMDIASRLGTENVARENLLDIRHALDEGLKTVSEKNIAKYPIIAHRFQSSLVRELGLVPVVVFGPASPEASAIANISKIQAPLIIDNIHNPVGQPFKEVSTDARHIQLLNFPGMKGTKTITDVIRYNVTQITSD
jgi:ABC-type metal ion transport system, periplasmic component/surface adhesin